jgi:murein DD-endopeptidase MepM/ murein hydrolase activator NlpD/aspartokinase
MAQNDNKISNVIGTHIPIWLLEQLQTRSKKGTQTNRDNANLQYLGNKTGWVRLVSSINITEASDTKYFSELTGLTLSKPEDLAKNFVLYGGVSKYRNQDNKTTYTLRKGFKETYSLLGDQEVRDFGYRPMPGLSRVVIETQGRLGSIRGATIEFKVWDKSQLDVIDALYFKLGYTMFLEWGNTFYYESESSDLKATELFSLDPFKDSLTKEQIALQLGSKRRESKGNYDGMLGMVSNFSFSYNQEGGYDCVLKLVGLGSLADSLKINQPATLAAPLKTTIEQLNSLYRTIQKQQDEKVKAEQAAADAKIKQDAAKAREEELNKNFKSAYDFLVDYNNEDENQKGSGAIFGITQAFFKKYAAAPSSLVVTSKKNKDYSQEKEYDYYYSPGEKLYIKKFGVILNQIGDINIQKTISQISWNGDNIKSRALVGKTAKEVASLAYISSENNYSIDTQYFSNSNYIIDPPYTGRTPYNFSITVQFPTSNVKTGNDITYAVTKREMFQNIVSSFTGEPMTYGEMSRTNITLLSKQNGTLLSDTLKDANGNYIAGFFNTKRENVRGTLLTNDGFYALEFAYEYKIPASTWKNTSQLQADGTYIDQDGKVKTTISIPVTLRITDSDLINGLELRNTKASTIEYQKYRDSLSSQDTAKAGAENTNPASNTSTEQTKPAVQYQSSLEAMLRSIQIHSLIQAINASSKKIDLERKVKEVNLATKEFASPVFSDGIFKLYIDKIISNSLSDSDPFEKNIKYGFNAALLSNKSDITPVPPVDYKKLLTSYVLPYDVNQDINEGSRLAHPVYIQLGLVMFILNHCCNLYDEKTDKAKTKTPLMYMDYNPETNFCLSHPCHMTTNGMTFMIPFQGTFADYKTLFYTSVLDGDSIKGTEENKNAKTALFSPEKDTISGDIPRFKGAEEIDAYRGKIMNVLVNIDYLFDIIKQFFSQDQTNSVFLKAFVEQILSDMNKTLGNFNIFRFSYDDASNCLQIIDDQLVPGTPEEDIVPKNSDYDIPIYGRNSIARSLDLRTDISSKMANVLAISANADVQKKSANSMDGTPYGFINKNYSDRYIPNRTENSDITKQKDGKTKIEQANIDAIVSSALKFNKNVTDFYGTYNPSTENIGHATNYYIEKLTVSKLDAPTRAAAMIPVSINFTLDGISGFNMMQGFTISEKFLPYTYNVRNTSTDEKSQISKGSQKVGFMVTGNVHTIENNEWTTAIKANMTYLKTRADFMGRRLNTEFQKGKQAAFNPEGSSLYNAIDPKGGSGGSTPRNTDLAPKSAASTSSFLFGTKKSFGNSISQPAHGARDASQQGQWQSTNAWDLFVPAFTPVYALFDGKVENINFYETVPYIWGYRFTLWGKTQVFYTHLDSVVARGAVKKGDLLGYVGQPPRPDYAWDTHLHIALKEGKLSTYLDATGALI